MNPTEATFGWIGPLIQVGSAAAALIVMFRFLAHLQEERKASDLREAAREAARKEEREAAEKRGDAMQAVFLAHNREIAEHCDERSDELVGRVEAAHGRSEAALRDLVQCLRNQNTKPA